MCILLYHSWPNIVYGIYFYLVPVIVHPMPALHCSTLINFISVDVCMSLPLTLLAPYLGLEVFSCASFL